MLVLSRKMSERILIGQDVRVVVVAIEGGRVRLGIEAPPSISILRGELGDRHPDPPESVQPGVDRTPAE